MTKLITILCALALNITGAQAEEAAPKPPPAQKTINANIYEKEKANSLSGKVKTTKTSREDTLVYFEGIKKKWSLCSFLDSQKLHKIKKSLGQKF